MHFNTELWADVSPLLLPTLLMTISLMEIKVLSLCSNTAQKPPCKKAITSHPPSLSPSEQDRSKFIFRLAHPFKFCQLITLACLLGQVSQTVCPPLGLLESFLLTKDAERCCPSKRTTHGSTGQRSPQAFES